MNARIGLRLILGTFGVAGFATGCTPTYRQEWREIGTGPGVHRPEVSIYSLYNERNSEYFGATYAIVTTPDKRQFMIAIYRDDLSRSKVVDLDANGNLIEYPVEVLRRKEVVPAELGKFQFKLPDDFGK